MKRQPRKEPHSIPLIGSRPKRGPRRAMYTRKLEEAERLFGDLREMSDNGIPIIVEGREDERALRNLNVNGTIHCLKARGESRFSFLDKLTGKEDVIILTDFDREGRELRLWLYEELTRRKIRADDKLWRRIRALAKAEVHAVEELPSFLKTVRTRALAFS